MARAGGGNQNLLFGLVLVLVAGLFFTIFMVARTQQTAVTIQERAVEQEAVGFPVGSLTGSTRNRDTFTLESSGDIELWEKGANVADPQDRGFLDAITMSSGTATSTSSTEYKSTDNQNTRDVYFEGGSDYYDEKTSAWSIAYNPDADKGVLQINGKDYIEITDIGTWKDMDTADNLGTSFADSGTDAFTYNVTDGTGVSSIRWTVGNSEADSELRQPVLCIGDADGDLEGDEITGLTISRHSGQAVANLDQINDIISLFTESAGTGADRCLQFGSVVPESNTGIYEIEFNWVDANFGTGEELEVSFDDLGNANDREYPSGSQKATKETITISALI